jgi:hypothetical protein
MQLQYSRAICWLLADFHHKESTYGILARMTDPVLMTSKSIRVIGIYGTQSKSKRTGEGSTRRSDNVGFVSIVHGQVVFFPTELSDKIENHSLTLSLNHSNKPILVIHEEISSILRCNISNISQPNFKESVI